MDIIKELSYPDLVHTFKEISVSSLNIENDEYKAKHITFEKVYFEGIVDFKNINFRNGIVFEKCQFDSYLRFENIVSKGYDLRISIDSVNVSFIDCRFNNSFFITGSNNFVERDILFKNCSFEKDLRIQNLIIQKDGLIIDSCKFYRNLFLENLNLKESIQIKNNTFISNIRISSIFCNSIRLIDNNNFKNSVHVKNCELNNGLIIDNNNFEKNVTLDLIESNEKGLIIKDSKFESTLFVNYQSIGNKETKGFRHFLISNSNFLNGLNVVGTIEQNIELPVIKNLDIHCTSDLLGNIIFLNLNIEKIELSGFNYSSLTFKNILVNTLKITNFINLGGVIFSNLKHSNSTDNTVFISDSNFGKALFLKVDFSMFSKVYFDNNVLTESSTSQVNWFTPQQLNLDTDSLQLEIKKNKYSKINLVKIRQELINSFKSKQEVFRQLKFVSQKHGDVPKYWEFQRHEMNYYKKVIQLTKPKISSESIILWSNQSNDFGQSWLKALGLLFLFSFIFYIPIGFINSSRLDYTSLANSYNDIILNLEVIFVDNFYMWIVSLNPIHRLQDFNIDFEKTSKWIYIWDILSRIVVSYFIFQMVSAFRKFNK